MWLRILIPIIMILDPDPDISQNKKWAKLAKEWPTHSSPVKKYTKRIFLSFFT
jgi:hypothetical protein